ncbi:MAG: hypothetical protein L7S70_05750 [Pseudomonadales bacterium]|nr:hypothetical protein [Pseudomonadales bacterium]
MKYVLVCLLLAGCSSFEEKQAHNEAQIKMIAVQREAQEAERLAEADARKALYQALSEVARANPDQAGAVTVALAVQGITEESSSATPIVQLQRQENTALEVAKVVLPSAVNLATGLGVAAINANVAKTQSDNAARIQINDAQQDANIVNAVAGLGSAAVQNAGSTISVSDNGYVNTGTYSEVNETTNTTTTNTETNTTDSGNTTTTTNNTESNNWYDSYNTTSSTAPVSYEGQEFTLRGLLEYLQGTGLAYTLRLGDTIYSIDGDGDSVELDCVPAGTPQFSPSLPVCEET